MNTPYPILKLLIFLTLLIGNKVYSQQDTLFFIPNHYVIGKIASIDSAKVNFMSTTGTLYELDKTKIYGIHYADGQIDSTIIKSKHSYYQRKFHEGKFGKKLFSITLVRFSDEETGIELHYEHFTNNLKFGFNPFIGYLSHHQGIRRSLGFNLNYYPTLSFTKKLNYFVGQGFEMGTFEKRVRRWESKDNNTDLAFYINQGFLYQFDYRLNFSASIQLGREIADWEIVNFLVRYRLKVGIKF
jgi:hypothetical protein